MRAPDRHTAPLSGATPFRSATWNRRAATEHPPPFVIPPDTQFYRADRYLIQRQCDSHRNVFDRLTDHQYYTGRHRERFDEFGNGRGLAGREYVYLNDGSTESTTRHHEVYSSVVRKPRRAVVMPGTVGVQKFGVQAVTPRLLWLYRYADGSTATSAAQSTRPPLSEMVSNGCRLLRCSSGEAPAPLERLEKFLSSWVVQHH